LSSSSPSSSPSPVRFSTVHSPHTRKPRELARNQHMHVGEKSGAFFFLL
jgi:hypothetical protein